MAEEEESYEVEEIVDKRIKEGKVEYFIKWKNYPSSENTWEPVLHLECAEMINQFESKVCSIDEDEVKLDDTIEDNSEVPIHGGKSGVELGYDIKEIIGGMRLRDQAFLTVLWKQSNTQELVSKDLLVQKYMREYLKFMEKRLTFKTNA